MQAMPGMVFAGVDLMIDKATDEAYVLEINSRPNLAGSLYPYNGTGDDVASAIIDLYFPETIKHRVTSKIDINKVNFNFSDIVKSLETGLISEVSIESIPNNIESKKIVLNGKVDSQFLKKWIYRTAQGLRLNSDIAQVNNKEVSIVLSGESEKIERF